MKKQDKFYAKTAMLAGEILLISGAEIFRIEETIKYILNKSGHEAQTMVFSTGIFINMQWEDGDSYTLVRRIGERSTNLEQICGVNQISRQLCSGKINIREAYYALKLIKNARQYSGREKGISYILIALFFAMMLGGTVLDCLAAAFAGGILGIVVWIVGKSRLDDFWGNVGGAFAAGIVTVLIKACWLHTISGNIVIVSSIMPLVPGTIFTIAVRDMLHGDYSSGIARMVEAAVTGLAVAWGVGTGMSIGEILIGGGRIL